MTTSKGRPFHDRLFSKAELGLMSRYGTKNAWIELAGKAANSARLIPILQALKPWQHATLCALNKDFQLVLIEKVFVRLPDEINGLSEAKVDHWIVDQHGRKNILLDRTEWVYLRGNESPNQPFVTFPQKRKRGEPRKRSDRFC